MPTSHRPSLLDTNAAPGSGQKQRQTRGESRGPAPGLEVALRYFSPRVLDTIPSLLLHSYHTEILKQINELKATRFEVLSTRTRHYGAEPFWKKSRPFFSAIRGVEKSSTFRKKAADIRRLFGN